MVKESFDVRFYHEMMSAKLQLVAQGFDGIVCAHSWPVAIAARQKIHFVYSPAGFVSLLLVRLFHSLLSFQTPEALLPDLRDFHPRVRTASPSAPELQFCANIMNL